MSNKTALKIGKNLAKAMEEKGLSANALWKLSGVSQPTISRTIRGENEPRVEILERLAPHLDRTVAQLLGEAGESDGPKVGEKRAAYNNIGETPIRKRVPVISLIQAGEMKEIGGLPEPGEGDLWEDYEGKLGPRSWAHIVVGDSMDDGTASSFPEGTVIFVDPDIEAQPGKFVIAKDVESQSGTFKKLTTDGARWFLTPLNKQYQAIPIDSHAMRIIGVVVQSKLARRH